MKTYASMVRIWGKEGTERLRPCPSITGNRYTMPKNDATR